MSARHEQSNDAPDQGKRHGGQHEQAVSQRLKRIGYDEQNDEYAQRDDRGKPMFFGLELTIFSVPLKSIAFGQFDLFVDSLLGFLDRSFQISPSYAELHGDIALIVFPIDHEGAD